MRLFDWEFWSCWVVGICRKIKLAKLRIESVVKEGESVGDICGGGSWWDFGKLRWEFELRRKKKKKKEMRIWIEILKKLKMDLANI